jgi:uncharacterized membrane protein SirB2
MDYATLKLLHVSCAALSIGGFALRGALMLARSPLLGSRIARVAPHVVDTVLLVSALALAWRSGQYPFEQAWLTAKVLALVAYVVSGSIALKRGRTRGMRAAAFVLALCAAFYIVAVALKRTPLPFV